MRQLLAALVGLLAIGALWFYMHGRDAREEQQAAARLDSGIAAEGPRGRIDPHGPPSIDKVATPLRVEARIAGSAPDGGAQLAIDLSALKALDGVDVTAERYDTSASVTPEWSGPVWSGNLRPAFPQHLAARIPYAAAPPVRIRVVARAAAADGNRFSVSTLLRPGQDATHAAAKP